MNETQKGEIMNSKLFKTFSILLAGVIVFSACEKDDPVIYGDVVGTWNLSALTGTYDRKVVTKEGVEYSADSYDLVASWDDAAGFAAAAGVDAALVKSITDFELASWEAGDNAPGFPTTNVFDAAALAALGIVMQGVFDDAPSKDKPGTYKITGTYPSVRLNTETCTPYLTVPQINDQGNYTLTFDATDAAGTIALAPATDLEQVLPPFPDGKFAVNGDAGTLNIDFLDRDSHGSRYTEVMAGWSEADDRVISGLSQLPVNTLGGFFTTPDDPNASEETSASGYVADAALAPWGPEGAGFGYLTWYSFNIILEISVKAADVKSPLTDLDGDGELTPTDMIIYMHADNLAGGGGTSYVGIPYALLVDSSNPAAPAPVNDSATDFALSGLATGAGGKMKFTILSGLCMPVDETIDFKSGWTSAE